MWVEHLLVDLRRDRYRPAAWLRYTRAALAFSRERGLANLPGVRSILLVALILFFAALAGAAALALWVDADLARRTFAWTIAGLVPMTALTVAHVDLLRDREGTPLDALGWPSAITLSRVALVPAFLVIMADRHYRLGLAIFAVGVLSDILDGWVARRFRQETRFGMILDPVADILCGFWLFVGLWAGGLVTGLAAALAALRMLLLLGGGSYLYVTLGPVRIHSTIPGKLTGLLMHGLVAVLLVFASFDLGAVARRLGPLVLDAVTVLLAFTLLYGIAIGWINLRRLRARPSGAVVVSDVRFGA